MSPNRGIVSIRRDHPTFRLNPPGAVKTRDFTRSGASNAVCMTISPPAECPTRDACLIPHASRICKRVRPPSIGFQPCGGGSDDP